MSDARLPWRFRKYDPHAVEKLPPLIFRGILGEEVEMSVRERMEQMEEEMEALFPRNMEIKMVRDWLAERGYVAPKDPSDVSAEVRTLLDHLASLGIVVEF